MVPERVQLKRTKGWRLPADTVVVSRPSRWGNPWRVGEPGCPTAAEAVRMFRARFVGQFAQPMPPESRLGWVAAHVHELRGKHLACWCAPGQPCHADVLLELANAERAAP